MRKEKIKALNLLLYGMYSLEDGVVCGLKAKVMAQSSDSEIEEFINILATCSSFEKRKIKACINYIDDTADYLSSWSLSDLLAFERDHWLLEDINSKDDLIKWFLNAFQKYRSEPFKQSEIDYALHNAHISIADGALVKIIDINKLIPRYFYMEAMENNGYGF